MSTVILQHNEEKPDSDMSSLIEGKRGDIAAMIREAMSGNNEFALAVTAAVVAYCSDRGVSMRSLEGPQELWQTLQNNTYNKNR